MPARTTSRAASPRSIKDADDRPSDSQQNSPQWPPPSHPEAPHVAISPSGQQHQPSLTNTLPSISSARPIEPPVSQAQLHQPLRIPHGQPPAYGQFRPAVPDDNTKPSRVAIPRNSRSDSLQNAPSSTRRGSGDSPESAVSPANTPGGPVVMTAPTGPMTKGVALPNRPRPGRKPIPMADAQDRRRNQNRQAQRNFRDKRQQKLEETTIELEQVRSRYQESVQAWQQQEAMSQQKLNAALERADHAEERAARAEEQLRVANERIEKLLQHQHSTQIPSPPESSADSFRTAMAPPTSVSIKTRQAVPPTSYPHEIDFTNFGRPQTNGYETRTMTTANDDSQMDFSMEQDDKCGFCTDDANCACREASRTEETMRAPEPISVQAVTLPGDCEKCRADPERARACRELASATRMTVRAIDNPPRPILNGGDPMDTSCSTMVDKFNQFGERTASIADLFGRRQMRAYPRPSGGYDLEEADAAEVLTSLHRRHRVTPNPSAPNPREAAAAF